MADPSDPLVVRNVEEQLLSEKKRKRKPGEVVYPLDYSSDMVDLDNWDHMFLRGCCRNITMHHFTTPPKMVLDLGCGGGLWSMEAAKEWPEAIVIGFDMKNIQPRLDVLASHANFTRRVQWVHGNLLDGLPFASNYFDFVRIVGIGLGVPEDEWQSVLEEVSRVLKPGAPLEIIEDDLIFPCRRAPELPRRPISVDNKSVDAGALSSIASGSQSTHSSKTLLSQSDASSSTSDNSEQTRTFSIAVTSSLLTTAQNSPPNPTVKTHHPLPPIDPYHTRLKASWEAMLARRFLPRQLLSVLPFYLSSTFINIQTHPPLQISLPPNSYSPKKDAIPNSVDDKVKWHDNIDPNIFSELRPSFVRSSSEADHKDSFAAMHLMKTVRTISGCKEAMRVEYWKIYADPHGQPGVTRTPRPTGSPKDVDQPSENVDRDEFEDLWLNWEYDMMDRIAARDSVRAEFLWGEPTGEPPDWQVWSVIQRTKSFQDETPPALPEDSSPELCRTIRCFVGWNPS